MSERYNGNTGWEQDQNGDVLPDYRGDDAPAFPG